MFNQFINYGENPNENFGKNYGEKFSSNECSIDGYCSADPIVYALMEVLFYEIKQLTYYYVKMQELGYENITLKTKIITYMSMILVGYEFNRNEFLTILKELHQEKENTRNSFIKVCDEKNIDCQILKSGINFDKTSLASLVNQGEKQVIKRNNSMSANMKNLYEIILNIIKSASIRLLEIKSYTEDYIPEEDAILRLFNNLNFSSATETKLIRKINEFAKVNYEIHKKLHALKEEFYGKISLNDVTIGVRKGKGILVSGQNLHDLENLLEATKDTDINIYTHNGLIVAHAYPKFAKYKNLAGHFQMSLDNIQFDFSIFKGPILIIRNFQYFLDKLYRGTLYTTNSIAGKGMTKIKNDDFMPLVNFAQNSEGFENDHKLATVKVGYDENFVNKKVDEIIQKINNNEIKHLIIIGLMNHNPIYSQYLEELEKNLPQDHFVISTALPSEKSNVLYFNSFFNSSLIYKILAKIKNKIDFAQFPVSVFITTCNQHTISHIFNLKYLGVKNVFLPECASNIITPAMLNFLKNQFGFKQVSSDPQTDLATE